MDLVVRNGIVAKRPDWMSKKFWDTFEAPRIGKFYDKGWETPYGLEYDIHYKGEKKKVELTDEEMFGIDDGSGCSGGGCKI